MLRREAAKDNGKAHGQEWMLRGVRGGGGLRAPGSSAAAGRGNVGRRVNPSPLRDYCQWVGTKGKVGREDLGSTSYIRCVNRERERQVTAVGSVGQRDPQ